ncbi:MAG: type II toxin-antitoxin system PemK/MazF family toxin [Defluviitaleaceae bacterium]|nr:type II toxin-antitoxin system PemK/MazF family toxin [Defluviitaleaceae bacterium]
MYKQGDILLIPLPFTDLSSQKRRPVFVVSKNSYNDVADDIIVMAVTSVADNKPYSVPIINDDMINGVLKVPSNIRVDKIYTLSQKIVLKYFGSVQLEVLEKVRSRLVELIGA